MYSTLSSMQMMRGLQTTFPRIQCSYSWVVVKMWWQDKVEGVDYDIEKVDCVTTHNVQDKSEKMYGQE